MALFRGLDDPKTDTTDVLRAAQVEPELAMFLGKIGFF